MSKSGSDPCLKFTVGLAFHNTGTANADSVLRTPTAPCGAGEPTFRAEEVTVTTRAQFTFRVDTWTPDGESIVKHVAGVEDYQVALATYLAAQRWPGTPITLRRSARVIEDSRRLRVVS